MTNEEKIKAGLCIAETNVNTGETTFIPYTNDEIAQMEINYKSKQIINPLDKLKKFLADNPDVLSIL